MKPHGSKSCFTNQKEKKRPNVGNWLGKEKGSSKQKKNFLAELQTLAHQTHSSKFPQIFLLKKLFLWFNKSKKLAYKIKRNQSRSASVFLLNFSILPPLVSSPDWVSRLKKVAEVLRLKKEANAGLALMLKEKFLSKNSLFSSDVLVLTKHSLASLEKERKYKES